MGSVKANHFNSDRLLTIESDGVKIKLNNNEKEKFNARYYDPCEIISKNGSVLRLSICGLNPYYC